ncbi:SDR family oxidoreductase [Bacillus sp. 2205SS5-2]|uniref:SDR family oxidoreductase n=1 Tax=Bacillus sp. 2205SS5-2 TaxID=3109031 RepID=UPI003006F06C
MKKKIAVVTGASSGFGLLSTIKLAKNDFYVIATMRDLQKKETLQAMAIENDVNEQIHYHSLDVSSKQSVDRFGHWLNELGHVDVLLNNAGYAAAGFAEEVSIDQYREQFETNFFGLIALTQKVIPLMRKQKKGRIINLSSISGLVGFPGLSPYVSSKFALEGFSESLRLELIPFGIEVFLIEPGSYQTNIWTTGKKVAEYSLQPESPYFNYMKKIENQLDETSFGDPDDIASLVNEIALGKKGGFRFPVGKGVKVTIWIKKWIPWSWLEKNILKRLT